ncbi:hypothetical protein RHGRI_038197 [Rhododendron griersonianum]|uniref:RNase H type-1 domain-containing protein n=1 Tax=Rhododendron griersonianum TaxID=479676 RepID=A0AAV6HY07_9ERIC|nr:hypothetical protein RHGRI_038197 [Rhododendron griersonianum]
MVIRDWQGNFIAARAIQRQRTTDPLLVEALAARECVKLARDLGINKIIIEGDCQQLTRMLQHHREEHRTVGVIVADTLRSMSGFSRGQSSVCEEDWQQSGLIVLLIKQ